MKREKQILAELEGGAKTAGEIVSIIYSEYPSSLHPAAEQSVLSHLDKLEEEGLVLTDKSFPPRYSRER